MAPRLWCTGLACAMALLGFVAAAHQLTRGFEHWTFESARRSDAHQQRLQASSMVVRTSQGQRLSLWPSVSRSVSVSPLPPSAPAKAYLVDFIYTTCPSVCQALGGEFTQMKRQLVEAGPTGAGVVLLSLSFDVQHDGTAELAQYAQRYGADSLHWHVAAPLSAVENRRLLQELAVIAVPDGQRGYVHNGAIHLLDGTGRLHAIYDTAQWRDALAAATLLVQAGL